MNPSVVQETFVYDNYHEIKGRGLVIVGTVEEDSRKVKPGMVVIIDGDGFTISGVEAFRPTIPTRPIGLLVRGLKKERVESFTKGSEFSILKIVE